MSVSSTVGVMGMIASTLVSLNNSRTRGLAPATIIRTPFTPAMDVMTDYSAQAGGIHVGNIGQVEDVEGWQLFARRRLKTQYIE